jgi:hypothetical protein
MNHSFHRYVVIKYSEYMKNRLVKSCRPAFSSSQAAGSCYVFLPYDTECIFDLGSRSTLPVFVFVEMLGIICCTHAIPTGSIIFLLVTR